MTMPHLMNCDHSEEWCLSCVKELWEERHHLTERVKVLEHACATQNDEICQTLGKALGLPRYRDDQANFPGATEADGACVGDHVAESLAELAAKRIKVLEGQRDVLMAACVHVIGCIVNGDGDMETIVRQAIAQCTEGQAGGEQRCHQ